jgi:hypothetical protein
MVGIPFDVIQAVYTELFPPTMKAVSYCRQPSPYITEAHCPPKRAPEIPRRGQF